MILCLNLNAAIDKTLVVPSFELNKIHRPESMIALAGGKGCNVARALKTLGEIPVISGWVGGFSGRFIEQELHREGIQTAFIYTDFESRTCTSILDRENQTMTEIYELGEPVPEEKINDLKDYVKKNVEKYQGLTLSGSIPPGVPFDFYAELIEIAGNKDVPTYLDTSGEALRKGITASPFFVKPNETEARVLLGLNKDQDFDINQAAIEISQQYGTKVLLTLGENGAVAAQGNESISFYNPTVEAKSAVGSGDCTVAGVVHGLLQGLPFTEAVICGMAAGTANTLMIGAGHFNVKDYEILRNQMHSMM